MSDRMKVILLLTPALLTITLLFVGGLVLGLMRSFNYMPVIGLIQPNLDAYRSILFSSEFYLSLGLTFYIAFTSTLLSCVLAVGAALALRRTVFGKTVVNFLFQLNLTIPHLVGAVGILYLFSQSGTFARIGHGLGLISEPADFPAFVYDRFAVGIILQYVWKEVPFVGVIVLANMQSIGDEYEAVSRSLGATRWQAFWNVLFPMILPSLLSASAIIFAFMFGAYEIPAILGQTYPAALPVMAYRLFTDVDLNARPQAMALAMVITLVSSILIFLYVRVARRYVRF